MLNDNQLTTALKALHSYIDHLEVYFDKYRDYMSLEEIKNTLGQIEEYKDICIEMENVIGDRKSSKMLS